MDERYVKLNNEDVLNIENAIRELTALSFTDTKDHLEIFTLQSIIALYDEQSPLKSIPIQCANVDAVVSGNSISNRVIQPLITEDVMDRQERKTLKREVIMLLLQKYAKPIITKLWNYFKK